MIPERKEKMDAMRQRLSRELKLLTKKIGMNSYLNGAIFPLLRERMNSMGIRSFFVHILSEYVKDQAKAEGIPIKEFPDNKIFDTQLPFLAEGIITVQYYENQILDGKGGILINEKCNMEKIYRNVIGSHFVKDFLYRYIAEEIFPNDSNSYRLVMLHTHRIFQVVDLGQAFQDHWGTFESLQTNKKNIFISYDADKIISESLIDDYWEVISNNGINQKFESFTRNYLRRISLTSGALFALMAELIIDLLEYHGKERERILLFAIHLGVIGQIVNDINDLVPPQSQQTTVSKIPEDAYADIRNNNVTLPLLFYFSRDNSQTIEKLKTLIERPEKLLSSMRSAINAAQQVAFLMAKNASSLIKSNSDAGFLLKDLNSVVNVSENRFYKALTNYMEVPSNVLQRNPVGKANQLQLFFTQDEPIKRNSHRSKKDAKKIRMIASTNKF